MAVGRVAVMGPVLAAMFIACAGAPPPPTTTARPAPSVEDEDEAKDENKPQGIHSCDGAVISIDPSEKGITAADVLLEPGPRPRTRKKQGQDEGPRGELAARAIKRAVEAAVPEIKCELRQHYGISHFVVECFEEDACRTTPETGHEFVKRIRLLLTQMVLLGLDTCACRAYY